MPTHKHLVFATTLLLATLNVMAGSGMIDTSYAPGVNAPVYAEAIQPDGRLVIGGAFYTVGGSSRYHIARLFANGALDTSFQDKMAGASGNVNCLAVQTDGRIVIGGTFTSVNGISRYGVARLNSNGAVDGSFVPTNNYYFNNVNALAVQSDNKVIIGLSYGPSYIYRLNADGSIETAFTNYSSGPSGPIYAVAIQSDGKIIIGGSFTSFNGISRNNIARLNADGSLDMSFLYGLSGAAGTVRCLQVQADGKILIGGDFTTVNGTSRGHSARLTSTGALDTGFNSIPGVNGSVYALALQSDSSVLVAGSFSYYVGSGSYYNNLARFYPDGTADTNFYSNFSSTVYSLAVQSDGGIIAGGSFTVFGQKSQPYLARVYGYLYPPESTHEMSKDQVAQDTVAPTGQQALDASPPSWTPLRSVGMGTSQLMAYPRGKPDWIEYQIELHRRFALPVACLMLAMVGIPLGIATRKGGRASGYVTAIFVAFFCYWLAFAFLIGMAKQGTLPVPVALWLPNAAFFVAGLSFLGRPEKTGGREFSGGLRARLADFFKAVKARARGTDGSGLAAWRLPLLPQLVDTYILSTFLTYLLLMLSSFVSLELIRNFFELMPDMLRNNISLWTMFSYLFFLSPKLIYDLLPPSVLVAVLASFGVMSKQNEITAFKACGVSLFRLAAPILVGSTLLSGGLFAFDFYYVASANRKQDALRD